jgi:hypothetical protein
MYVERLRVKGSGLLVRLHVDPYSLVLLDPESGYPDSDVKNLTLI